LAPVVQDPDLSPRHKTEPKKFSGDKHSSLFYPYPIDNTLHYITVYNSRSNKVS